MRLSEIFNLSIQDLNSRDVFNADVDEDSHLHIDPSLFKECNIPEFVGAYDEFRDFFINIFSQYVPYAKDNNRYFKSLVDNLTFKEVANTSLGYSKRGTHGNGIGRKLSSQIANSIIEIYELGISNPTVFEMLPFFEDQIGADRISDMTAHLLINRFITFTQRVCKELAIPMEPRIRINGRSINVPTYQGLGIIFVPSSVLCDLPTADSWYDIDSVSDYNRHFRRRICEFIGIKLSDVMKFSKKRIKEFLFENPDMFESFIEDWQNTRHLSYNFIKDKRRIMKNYSIEIREAYGKKYIKVFFADTKEVELAKDVLTRCGSIYKVNITESKSCSHKGNTLTVYPKPMYEIQDVEQDVNRTLDSFFSHKVIMPEQIVNTTVFESIKSSIIAELTKAINTIYICVAWFTDDELRDVLEDKRKEGVDVRVIVYDDGVNKRHGVDFGEIHHKSIKAERHGIMHRKYCIIDNHIVISGSYNWTDNAANRNDENIVIVQDWTTANQHSREFLDEWNKKL